MPYFSGKKKALRVGNKDVYIHKKSINKKNTVKKEIESRIKLENKIYLF